MKQPFSFKEIQEFSSGTTIKSPLFLSATDGMQLAYYPFLPDQEPKAIVIFYHGGGVWSNKTYQKMAQVIAQDGSMAVYLVDIRGHGNSGGPRGDAPSAQQVWQDVRSMVDFVKEQHPNQKIFLAGHSAGAGLLLNYSGWDTSSPVDGYLFFAPYLGPQSGAIKEHADHAESFVKDAKVFKLIVHAISGGWLFNHSPAVFFNYPVHVQETNSRILLHYTCAMSAATSPHDPKRLFSELSKPCALYIGELDEQFIPEKVIAYKKCLRYCVAAEIIPDTKHLSILCKVPEYMSKVFSTIKK